MRIIRIMPVAMTAIMAACAGPAGSAPEEQPVGNLLVRGPIERLDHRATASGMLVAGGPDSPEPCGIQATLLPETPILGSTAGGLERLAVTSLEVGDRVEVYVDGAVLESCPVQGEASTVVLLAD